MRRIAALSTFLLLVGASLPALADVPTSRSRSKKNCSVSDEDNGMLGFAALALLLSGVALRRRSSL
jgi:MYXO-CTERM domain-containing protein